ncbi:MAG: hypothetical protein ACI3ZS_00655 [Candidatus Cryptobacteroides sp.]
MKRTLAISAAIICLCGCGKFFTPMSITMSSDGETITVETIIFPETLDILNYDGEGVHSPEYDEAAETFTVTNDWLTASIATSSYNGESYEMTLVASKNTTGKRRTLYVGGMYQDLGSSMKVTQK